MKSFHSFIKEANAKRAVFVFGRFNPPTKGHMKVIDKALMQARRLRATPFIFFSRTHDGARNPLTPDEKFKYLQKSLGVDKKFVMNNSSIKSPFQALDFLIQKGYKDITFIVGDDRVAEFNSSMGKYVTTNNLLDNFSVISAGKRDPDKGGIEGISATKMRNYVKSDDFKSFRKGLSSKMNDSDAQNLFNNLKKKLK